MRLLKLLETYWNYFYEETAIEKMGKGYWLDFNKNFIPMSSEYSDEISKLKNEIDRISDKFGYSYEGRADKSLDYSKYDGLGFRVGFEDKGHGFEIILVPNRNLEKILGKKEVSLTKTASYDFNSLISKIAKERKLDSVLSQVILH